MVTRSPKMKRLLKVKSFKKKCAPHSSHLPFLLDTKLLTSLVGTNNSILAEESLTKQYCTFTQNIIMLLSLLSSPSPKPKNPKDPKHEVGVA